MQLHKAITKCLLNKMIKCSVRSKDIYAMFIRNGDKNEICKCCDSLTVNHLLSQ